MNTIVLIPDRLFEAAGRLVGRLRMLRGKLYAKAVANYVDGHSSSGVRERLDAVYAAEPESSQPDAETKMIQSTSIPTERWQSEGAMCGFS